MRKITKEAVEAFTNWGDYVKDNTEVMTYGNGVAKFWLHWNIIAEYNRKWGELYITTAGRNTTTTKERLNWILEAFNLWKLQTIKWQLFLINWEKEIFNWEKLFNL